MSVTPNTVLLLTITPHDSNIDDFYFKFKDYLGVYGDEYIKIGNDAYSHEIINGSEFSGKFQLNLPEYVVLLDTYITSRYGDVITFSELESIKKELQDFGEKMSKELKCDYEICIGATYE